MTSSRCSPPTGLDRRPVGWSRLPRRCRRVTLGRAAAAAAVPQELRPQRGGVLADPRDPLGLLERLGEPHGRCRDMFHGRPEVPEDLRGLDPRIAADGDDGRGPDEHDLRVGGDLVDHRDGHHADAVVEDDDVRSLVLDHAREVGGTHGFADHVEAFALEDEAKKPSLRRATFADDDPYPSCQLCLPAAVASVPHLGTGWPQPYGGIRAEWRRTAGPVASIRDRTYGSADRGGRPDTMERSARRVARTPVSDTIEQICARQGILRAPSQDRGDAGSDRRGRPSRNGPKPSRSSLARCCAGWPTTTSKRSPPTSCTRSRPPPSSSRTAEAWRPRPSASSTPTSRTNGYRCLGTVIEVATDDSPFLVDSISGRDHGERSHDQAPPPPGDRHRSGRTGPSHPGDVRAGGRASRVLHALRGRPPPRRRGECGSRGSGASHPPRRVARRP